MKDIDITLTRRRVLAGILVIGLAAAAAGVGTFALFSDEVTSDENSISAGTLDLDDPDNGQYTVENLYPGQTVDSQTINTNYTAEIEAELTVGIDLEESGVDQEAEEDFAEKLSFDQASLVVIHENGTESTIESWSGTLNDLDGEYTDQISGGDQIELSIGEMTFASGAGNEYQGAEVNATVTFNATQVSN